MSNLLPEALERAIPGHTDGPLLPDAHARLATGRRSVRRRRLAAGGLVAALAAAAVVVPSALVNGSAPDRQVPQVADGGTTSTVSPGTVSPGTVSPTPPDAGYDSFTKIDGTFSALVKIGINGGPVSIAPGVTVLDEVPTPFSVSGRHAYAATVEYQGRTYWALSYVTLDGGSYSTYEDPAPGLSIERWVRDYEVLGTAGRGHRWLDLADDGSVTPRDGAVVLSQRSPASVTQADPAQPSAVAMLEVDGGRICVITRRVGTGSSEELALPESQNRGCTDLPGWHYPGNPVS